MNPERERWHALQLQLGSLRMEGHHMTRMLRIDITADDAADVSTADLRREIARYIAAAWSITASVEMVYDSADDPNWKY